MFIDEAVIQVRAGRGGNGCVSFRREKFVPKGGPDGGDGGHGGNILLVVDPNMRTLQRFRHQERFSAEDGEPGRGKQMSGRSGTDCVIRVPPGTVVQGAADGRPVADLVSAGETAIVARGGRGGKGNVHFKTAQRRAPRMATPGREGAETELRLTLKLLADVGLIGLPNVGKSTLLRRLSNATPRVGDYAFTTLRPNLGIVSLGEEDSFVMADIPGLVEGAHEGRGLGTRFLRHIERTRLLLFLIDSASPDPAADLRTLLQEIGAFSHALLRRPRILCFSRSDLAPRGVPPPALAAMSPHRISAVTGEGITELLAVLRVALGEIWRADESGEGEIAGGEVGLDTPAEPAVSRGSCGSADGSAMGPEDSGPAGVSGGAEPCFADRVDRGLPLGGFPWPRRSYVETAEAPARAAAGVAKEGEGAAAGTPAEADGPEAG